MLYGCRGHRTLFPGKKNPRSPGDTPSAFSSVISCCPNKTTSIFTGAILSRWIFRFAINSNAIVSSSASLDRATGHLAEETPFETYSRAVPQPTFFLAAKAGKTIEETKIATAKLLLSIFVLCGTIPISLSPAQS